MKPAPSREYCSELAKAREEPLYGTAVRADLWLLLEYPRPWKPKALLDNELPAAVNAHLTQLAGDVLAASGRVLRVQFIKQAASSDRVNPRLFLADTRIAGPCLVEASLANYTAIQSVTADELLAGSLPGGAVVPSPIYLVCTNGQRDLCCARFGRPLYESLRQEIGQRVWQTTHIGGHRYSPNLVCLPNGVISGFVEPELALGLVQKLDAGDMALAHLRGRSAYETPAQAAEYFLMQDLGLSRDRGVQLESLVMNGEVVTARFYASRAQAWDVAVRQSKGQEKVIASCGAEPKAVDRFELLSITASEQPA